MNFAPNYLLFSNGIDPEYSVIGRVPGEFGQSRKNKYKATTVPKN